MADETEDVSNMEQVSICARFVHNCEVHEEFLGFVAVPKRLLWMLCFLHFSSGELTYHF